MSALMFTGHLVNAAQCHEQMVGASGVAGSGLQQLEQILFFRRVILRRLQKVGVDFVLIDRILANGCDSGPS